MSLETRLSALITAIGADIKALQAASGGSPDPFYTKPRKTIEFFEDFVGGTLNNMVPAWSDSSGQVAVLTSGPPDDNTYGIVSISTASNSVGRGGIRTVLDQFVPGKGKMYFAGRVYVPALSDGTDRYGFRVGFGDSDWGEMVDGVYFEYDHTDTHWKCVCAASSTRTKFTTTVTVAALTFYNLGVEINAAGTEAKFYINDTLVATITTNIPTASYQRTAMGAWIVKTLGSTARAAYIDYLGMKVERTTMR